MGAPEVTYAFYCEEFGGALGEDGFKASLAHALAEVRRLTWPNDPGADERAYRRAVCAAIDVDAAHGATGGTGSGLSSVTAGSVSMSFAGAPDGATAYEADMARAVAGELAGTGLLFMGLG